MVGTFVNNGPLVDAAARMLNDVPWIVVQTCARNNLTRKTVAFLNTLRFYGNSSGTVRIPVCIDDVACAAPPGATPEDIVHSVLEHMSLLIAEFGAPQSELYKFLCGTYENIRHLLVGKMVSTEKNTQMLQHCPHLNMGNLSAVFLFRIAGKDSDLCFLVTEDMAKRLKVSTEQLLKDAIKNFSPRVYSLMEFVAEKIGLEPPEPSPIFILSDKSMYFGAFALMEKSTLAYLAKELHSDLYILPSSVHELLILPVCHVDLSYLRETVLSVNCTEVSPEDVLSDSVYLFRADRGDIVEA